MSDAPKKKRPAPRAKPAAIPMHPLFAMSKNTDPLPLPIESIDVYRVTTTGRRSMIAVVPADDVPDEMSIEKRFGPGSYHLIGRDITRTQILRHADCTVGDFDEAPPPPAAAQPTSPAQPATNGTESVLMMFMRDMQESRKETISMVTAFAERGERQSENVLKIVTAAMGARTEDFAALARGKQGGGGLTLEQVREIQHDAIATAEAARASAREDLEARSNAADAEVSEIEIIKTVVDAAKTFGGGGANNNAAAS